MLKVVKKASSGSLPIMLGCALAEGSFTFYFGIK